MIVSLLGAPYVVPLHLLGNRHHVDAVEERDFVGCADWTALGAGAVIAVDVNDERIIELAHVFDRLNNTTDFIVVIRLIGSEDLDLLDKELLFLGRAIIPVLKNLRRPRLDLGVRRN